jgi:Leucine-rich repeat (LRR) protein
MKNSLSSLNLANNKLHSLAVETLAALSNLTEVNLSDNDWLCDKRMLKGNLFE